MTYHSQRQVELLLVDIGFPKDDWQLVCRDVAIELVILLLCSPEPAVLTIR